MRSFIATTIIIALVGCVGHDDDLSMAPASHSLTSCPPDVPVLFAPSGDISEPTPLYSWSAVPGATNYIFEVHDSNGVLIEFRQFNSTTSHQGYDLSAHAHVQLNWRLKSECGGLASPYSSPRYFRYVPPPPPEEPPPKGHDGQCYPSLKACLKECTGVCERRINCGGATAHKCFE